MSILVVESDLAVRHPLSEYLRECGYRVVEAADADEAIVILTQNRVDIEIVVCDVGNSEALDGFGLAKWMRAHVPDIQLILAANPDRLAKQAAGICEDGPLLSKPYDHQFLLDRIKQMMARRDRARPVK